MKKTFKIMGVVLMIAIAVISMFGIPDSIDTFLGVSEGLNAFNDYLGLEPFLVSIATLPIWFVMKGTEKEFVELTKDQLESLTDEEFDQYKKDQLSGIEGRMVKLVAEESKASESRLKEIQTELNEVKDEQMKTMKSAMKKQMEVIEELKASGVSPDSDTFRGALKKAWDENAEKLDEAIKSRSTFEITVKAEQTYGDINAGLDFAQMKPGITDIPTRRPRIRELFSSIPVSTEFLKYVEQDTVIRDAQNVAKCAAVVSTTKETIIVRSIETKVIKDMVDFCRMFVSDYPFMQSRINKLLNQSLALRVDSQLLLGDGTGENTFSISSTASVFDENNVVCPVAASIQAATMVDLILAMQTQIIELGQQEDYDPNVVLVNKCDWFKQVESRKDLNNNYLDGRVTMINGTPFIGGMAVLWTPIVATDSLYVFDSTKGEVVDRQELVIEVAFENKDNWEKQIASLQGYERLNFLVPNNWKNAFMKTTQVALDIAAIDKP